MKRNLTLIKTKLILLLFCGGSLLAADPAQYGTPFTGVPDPRDVTIYQVNMRCFSATRDLKGVLSRLDDIKALGVNIVQLMPINPIGTGSGTFNSPYCITDYKSIGSEYGNLTDLRTLVDSAHSLGMAVILDFVANHTSYKHPWITAHKYWYELDGNGNIKNANNWTDVAQLNFSNDTMRAALIDAMRYWVFEANIDGYRFDYAGGPPSDFWKQAVDSLRSIDTHNLILFAEGDENENYASGFDYNFSWRFYNNLKDIKDGSSVTIINTSNSSDYVGATGTQQVVRWLSNHDIYGSEGSPYTIFGGKAATLANFVVSAYMKGIPFIYNGMEVGNRVAMPFPFTSSIINWTQDISVTPEMTKIISLRNSSEAIRRGTLKTYSSADVCAFKKVSESDSVFVLINLRNTAKTFTLPTGIAHTNSLDAFGDTAVTLGTDILLAPYEYRVFKIGVVTSVNHSSIPATSVYPNPTDGFVHIDFAENFSDTNVSVYDLRGKKVFETSLHASESSIDLSGLESGMYVLNLSSIQQADFLKLLIK